MSADSGRGWREWLWLIGRPRTAADKPADKPADKVKKVGPGWRQRRRNLRHEHRTAKIDKRAERAQTAEITGPNGAAGVLWLGLTALVLTTIGSAGFAFWFSLENVRQLAADVGIPFEIQGKIAPALDVIVIGLTVVVQCMALLGIEKTYIQTGKRMLMSGAVASMTINMLPSFIGIFTTKYTGTVMRAVEGFTPSVDQLTREQLIIKTLIEILLPAALVYWSHAGPKIVIGFASRIARRDQEALEQVTRRTLATEQDRAAAAAELRAVADRRDQAERRAAELMAEAQAEANEVRQAASREAAELRQAANRDAEQAQSQAVSQGRAERERAERELSAARSAKLTADTEASRAEHMIREAERQAAELVDAARRAAEKALAEARHGVEMLNQRSATELAEARRLNVQAAADKAAADAALAEAQDMMRLAEEIADSEGAPARKPRPGGGRDAQGDATEAPKPPDLKAVPPVGRKSAEQLIEERVALVKQQRPDWAAVLPTQTQIAEIIGLSGGSACSPVRQRLERDSGSVSARKSA